ncbi:nuclease-related domain-containing protein [Natranaerofaba carboxydovora]|uniref:nuclease-related domain-containing protein n=1 Tax=Natranaerofaba carboxydovora TaxID=2742683 RepID=UPI001F129A58|nr:nuclease-related domain-containing protein [Natranaerofaba carboxydovora]UMZ74658.1 Nuclease-related domain protein [Natranaerofaba carboxydovora]
MAIVLKGEKSLEGKIKRKEQARDQLKGDIKETKSKLWTLRKEGVKDIFEKLFGKDNNYENTTEEKKELKEKIKSKKEEIEKLDEEITALTKGHAGEEVVTSILKQNLSDEYYILSGKKIGGEKEKAEIDHLVIGPKGIILIEVKNTSGIFYYDSEGEGWLKAPFSGKNALITPMKSPQDQVERASRIFKGNLNNHSNINISISNVNINTAVVFADDKCVFNGIENRFTMKTPLLLKDEIIPYINSLPQDKLLYNNNEAARKLSNIILTQKPNN